MTEATRATGGRRCPVCQAAMTIAKRGSIEIDVCEEHGVWLDQGELKAIAERMRQRDRANIRSQLDRSYRSGKVSGVLFGPLGFLFD